MVKMTLPEVIQYFNAEIEKAQIYLFPTRRTEALRIVSGELEQLLMAAGRFKQQAINKSDEKGANLFLGFECVIACIRAEIRMWILLKEERPNDAWDQLIAAQMASLDAIRSDVGFSHMEKKSEALEVIEKNVFPPQAFSSAGLKIGKQLCSICDQNYATCSHLSNKPYMGQICTVIACDIAADHVALVEKPADKRCRAVSIKKEGGASG